MDQFEFWWMSELSNFWKESCLDDKFELRAGGDVQNENN